MLSLNLFDLREFFSVFLVLFAIIDITGSTPIIIDLKNKGKTVSATKASIISLIIFVGFFYVGDAFLQLFGLDLSSFAVAGSMILFVIALEMILDIKIFRDSPDLPKDATITPIVFPLIVGAGSLTTLLSIRSQYHDINVLLAVLANMLVVYIIITLTNKFEKLLAPEFIYIIQKLFGIILLAISVKLFMTNLSLLLKSLS